MGSSRASRRSPASSTNFGRSRHSYSSSRSSCTSVARWSKARMSASRTPPPPMSFYQHHVFFCLNKRDAPENCCACHGSEKMQEYAKKRVKELKLSGPGKVRINKAGCLDRCEEGPVMVVYPEEV